MAGSVLFLIPARGGSKGLQQKNLIRLAGIPLVGHSARTALAAARNLPGSGHRVVCSTDDARIAEAARLWGAEVPFVRPEALSDDLADAVDVALHALDFFAKRGELFVALALVQPTSPLTLPEDFASAVSLFLSSGGTSVASVSPVHPPSWTYRLDQGRLKSLFPPVPASRRQDVGECFSLNGAVFVVDPERLRRTRRFVEPDETLASIMPPERGVDIDVESDLRLCEALFADRASRLCGPARPRREPDIWPIDAAGLGIGPGHACFIIAEAGVNHNGSVELARRLVDAAAAAGADAVKFQTFRSESVVARSAEKALYQQAATGGGSQLEMVRALELPYEAFRELSAHCKEREILFTSTPYDEESADFLVELGVPFLKVPSGEITNLPFLAHLSGKGKPLVVSTGMASIEEVETAIRIVRENGNPPVALLQCVSNYPADPVNANLFAMHTLACSFRVPVGYSDHTPGTEVALAAVALGACIIEKHLTLDRSLPGPDHAASADLEEFTALCRGIRIVEAARGHGRKEPAAAEAEVAAVARRSLVAARDMEPGTVLTPDLIAIKRPGTGLAPSMRQELIGRVVKRAVLADAVLTLDLLK